MTKPGTTTVAAPVDTAVPHSTSPQNLFISVRTFNVEGKTIGERIVDMFHYGTTKWLTKHLWWSTQHGYCTEVDVAKPEEIEAYLAAGKLALVAKYNGDQTPAMEAAAAELAA